MLPEHRRPGSQLALERPAGVGRAAGRQPVHRQAQCRRHPHRAGRFTAVVSGEGYFLKLWRVEIRDEAVWIGMEESKGLFGFFK